MVKATINYEGDLHCVIRHGPSGTELQTDAPVDNQGRGESFSPTDLVASALGACASTILGILARDKGWDFRGMRVEVKKGMEEEPRRISSIDVHFHMPIGLDPESRAQAEAAARSCPVALSIRQDMHAPMTFHWPEG